MTDTDDIEPRIREILEAKRTRRLTGPYMPRTEASVRAGLEALLGAGGSRIASIARMAGGASKEQFVLVRGDGDAAERLVLRMDPLEGLIETCRRREAQVLRAMAGCVPVPEVRAVDAEGTCLGLPGLVTSFVPGVTKPPQGSASVSGLRTEFDEGWVARLAPAFLDHLVRIHAFDYRGAALPDFAIPGEDPRQVARRQVNWWAKVWRDDAVDAFPVMAIAESWMRAHLPICTDPVLVHGDYRTGNFLFDPEDGRITAILDWELAHVGDFHEDLAWNLQPIFASAAPDGSPRVSGLFARADFLAQYERCSGRTIDPATLHFYEVFNAWKCAVIDLSSCLSAARDANNHQDILLSWLATSAHMVLDHLTRLLIAGEPAPALRATENAAP